MSQTSDPAGSNSASASPLTSPAGSAISSADPAWTLVWGDEFDEPAGSPPNPEHWGYARGDGTGESIAGWGNNELEYYSDKSENVATDGAGNLVITARAAEPGLACYYGPCKYTSARLLTSGKFDLDVWPGRGPDQGAARRRSLAGVLDARHEHRCGRLAGVRRNRRHGERRPPAEPPLRHAPRPRLLRRERLWQDDRPARARSPTTSTSSRSTGGRTGSSGPSTAREFHTATPGDVAPNDWVYNHAFYLLLNLAVGGNFGGPVSPDTAFPASMLVDYVRVYAPGG